MLMPLLVALVTSSSPAPVPPSVQVWLSHRRTFGWGVRAGVLARASASGYLLVFHTDAAGRVRVLFPRRPGEDQFVQGGRTYELDGAADDTVGSGSVVAVIARAPFAADRFARDGHWDVDALAGDHAPNSVLASAREMASGDRVRVSQTSFAVGDQPHPRPDSRQYAERDVQPDQDQPSGRLAQTGQIFYPLAYGYSTSGWNNSRGGLGSAALVGALGSFPYRYDHFYSMAPKSWW